MTPEKLKAQIEKQTDRLTKLKLQEAMRARADKEKEKKAARAIADEARKADAHRKIELGGLVIAAGVDHLNPATLVGALLRLVSLDDARLEPLTRAGIEHLDARAQERKQ